MSLARLIVAKAKYSLDFTKPHCFGPELEKGNQRGLRLKARYMYDKAMTHALMDEKALLMKKPVVVKEFTVWLHQIQGLADRLQMATMRELADLRMKKEGIKDPIGSLSTGVGSMYHSFTSKKPAAQKGNSS